MKINSLLAGTLALVLFAGLVTPSFAQEGATTAPGNENPAPFSPQFIGTDENIFENGEVTPDVGGWRFDGPWTPAEDFFFDEPMVVTDFHFVMHDPDLTFSEPVDYFIYEDDGGIPGEVIDSGTAQNLELIEISQTHFEVWFFLEEPFDAEADVTYWFGIHSDTSGVVGWQMGIDGLGNNLRQFNFDDDTWFERVTPSWFILTGHPPIVVGGELLPIDSTALMLAGLQSSAIWMLPILAGAASAGFAAFKLRKK